MEDVVVKLRTGDKIEYKPYGSQENIIATVTRIEESHWRDEKYPSITTSATLANLSAEFNGTFRIIESVHDDCPPPGTWCELSDVKMIHGVLDRNDKEIKDDRRRSADKVICSSEEGMKMAALNAGIQKAKKTPFGTLHTVASRRRGDGSCTKEEEGSEEET